MKGGLHIDHPYAAQLRRQLIQAKSNLGQTCPGGSRAAIVAALSAGTEPSSRAGFGRRFSQRLHIWSESQALVRQNGPVCAAKRRSGYNRPLRRLGRRWRTTNVHHERFDAEAQGLVSSSNGPLSVANGALDYDVGDARSDCVG